MISNLSSNLKTVESKKHRFKNPENIKHHLFHSTHYKYCNKYIPEKHKVDRQTFINVTRFIFSQVADGMLTERDGVVLDDFGYFFIFMTPKPRNYYKGYGFKNTIGRTFYPMFRGIGRNNPLIDYYIPYSAKKLRKKIEENIKNEQLYTFSLKLLQSKSVENEYEKYLLKLRQRQKNKNELVQ